MRFGKFMTKAMDVVLNYFGYLCLLAAGGISALSSALIEFKVVSAFMASQLDESFSYLAFFIVFAAETTKIFSIYFHKQYTISENQDYGRENVYKFLRFVLVTLSIVCTIIFLFNELHNPEYESRFSQATSEADAEYERRLANINSDFDKRLDGIGAEVEYWKNELAKEAQDVQRGQAEGVSFRAIKPLYNEAVRKRDSQKIRLEQERSAQIMDLDRWHKQTIDMERERLREDSSSHNSLISAVLQVLTGETQYSKKKYMLLILSFSLLISVVLESIIIYVFQVLAVECGDMQ